MKRLLLIITLSAIFTNVKAQDQMPSPTEIRAIIAGSITQLNIAPESIAEVKNEVVVTGNDSVQIRIYRPVLKAKLPVIFQIHGGAMVAGDLDTHDNICRYLANHTQSVVVAVHYRRPPESKFPAALNDCHNVLKWIGANMKKLNGNGKLVLLGDSAGGQLSGALALVNAKEKKPLPIAAQVLVNPALDVSKGSATYAAYSWMVEAYINPNDDPKDNRLSPLLATNFKGVPPAVIVVCENDELRPEGEAYHKKLTEAGIPSKLFLQPKTGHLAELWCAASPKAQPAMDFVVAELKKVFKE